MRRADDGITRRCSRCHEVKSVSAFYARGDCRRPHCKECIAREARLARKTVALEHPERVLVRGARTRARRAGLPFSLCEADVRIPSVCPILGIPLEGGTDGRGPKETSATVDRIVPERGYVRDNVIVISWRANRLKSDATADELAKIISWYSKQLEQ